MRLQELRELLYATAHDRVLVDWVFGRLANTSLVAGYCVYKYVQSTSRRDCDDLIRICKNSEM